VSVLPPAWGTLYLLSRLDDPTICASPIRYLSRCARGIWGLSGESGDYRGLVTNSVRERVLLRSRGVAQPDRAPVVCCKVLVSTIETLRAGRLRVQVPPPHPIVENKRSPPATPLCAGSPRSPRSSRRQTLDAIIKDGNRAGDVIGRIRALIKKAAPRADQFRATPSPRCSRSIALS
jgi:hypothetical protein